MDGPFSVTPPLGAKRRLTRAAATASCVALTGLALAACGGDDESTTSVESSDADFVIGASVPLTGGLESVGPAGEKAAELAVAQLQEALGDETSVELIVADNQTDPDASVEAARQLVEGGADCIVGAWASTDTIDTATNVTIPQGVLQISPASSSDGITGLDDQGLLNRTVPPDSDQGLALASAVTLTAGEGKTVNIGARDDDYGAGIADKFTKEFEDAGGTVGARVELKIGQGSYDAEAKEITSGNPDAILIADRTDNFPALYQSLDATGDWDPSIAWGPDGLAASSLLEDPGADAVAGMRVTAPGAPEAEPATKAFADLYSQTDPTDVSRQRFDAQTFDATVLCYLASAAAGSTEGADMAPEIEAITGPGGEEYAWDELPAAISALEAGDDIDYVGASGQLDIDADGDPTAGSYQLYEFGKDLKPVGIIPFSASGK